MYPHTDWINYFTLSFNKQDAHGSIFSYTSDDDAMHDRKGSRTTEETRIYTHMPSQAYLHLVS